MTDGFDRPTAYGHIDGIDDPSMGWARYAQVLLAATCLLERPGMQTGSRIQLWRQASADFSIDPCRRRGT